MMSRGGNWAAALAVAWTGAALFAEEPKPLVQEVKPIDLSALREAVTTASRRGENVDEVRSALDALEKALPTAQAGRVPPELQALRDAVDTAARKGENVAAVAKELLAIEKSVAGRSLTRPRPQPNPDPAPVFPNPGPAPLGVDRPNISAAGVDLDVVKQAMDLHRKADAGLAENPDDPNARKEMMKLHAQADELMRRALRGTAFEHQAPEKPGRPEGGRATERPRLNLRLESVPAVAANQLGLEADTGVVISFVSPGSAAEKAGLRIHDIILELAGKPVTNNTDDFIRRVDGMKVGEPVDIVVLRKGKTVNVKGVELRVP